MQYADGLSYRRQSPNTFLLQRLAEELIFKGALFLGAGLGLYIALRVLEGVKSPKYSGCIIRSPS